MKTFNKENLKELINDIELALAEVEKKYGVELKVGSVKFNETTGDITLKANISGEDTQEMKNLKNSASVFGFTDNISNATVDVNGISYKVTGHTGRKKILLSCVKTNKVGQINYDDLRNILIEQNRTDLVQEIYFKYK